MNCPRRLYAGQSDDHWREGNSCSYCGSLNPDELMARIEAGTVELGPTDKNYKVYVDSKNGDKLGSIKFYFEHFSEEQKKKFVELYNAKHLHVGVPGHFYRLPYFMSYTP